MGNSIGELRRIGQSVWYDNIRRGLIKSGELKKLIDLGVSGLTSNPTIFEKAISESDDYDDALLELAGEGLSVVEIYESLAMEDIRAAADLLRPSYDDSEGADGYASLEVNPHLARDTAGTVAEAKRLFAELDRPNVMVKVPATSEGIPAIHRLIGEGLNINATLTFALSAYRDVRQAYVAGLEDLDWSGGDVGRSASVASFFVSRVDTAVDSRLEEQLLAGNEDAQDLLGEAAVANARLAYRGFKEDFEGGRFAQLRANGARPQRPLWASTSTKNPEYSDVKYVESLIGADTVNTMPDATLEAVLDHGEAAEALEQNIRDAERVFEALEQAGISMEQVADKLLVDGVKQFADSFDGLLSKIDEKSSKLAAGT